MSQRLASLYALCFLGACGGAVPEDADLDPYAPAAMSVQPAPGVYTSRTLVNGFPLGKCGYSGTTAQRDSDMNHHNAPYTMEWSDDYCLTLRASTEDCRLARDPAECQRWRAQLMKIIFPMDFNANGACLTAAQRSKLASSSNMKSIDIGGVYAMDAANPASPRPRVGSFKIFRHNGNYQYEMLAAGSRQPFLMNPAFRAAFPNKTNLDGVKLCFDRNYVSGLGLPAGQTPFSCTRFTDQAKAQGYFGDKVTRGTAYGFYDPAGHNYCPVSFAARR